MHTKSFSARLDVELLGRLRRLSVRERVPLSQLVERFLEEAARSEELPGIVFRSGPAGRRAGVIGGPDVWEIVRDVQSARTVGRPEPVRYVARSTDLSEAQVGLAVSYYATYSGEIDARIAAETELSARLLAGVA
ncbi:CopG family transcriptional regulator [Gaiella sp.]|uniref:CopG family transcriptional regulator n=1 Tax=Gaiella sp. TaxID=2663207 RepID=UPI003983A96E